MHHETGSDIFTLFNLTVRSLPLECSVLLGCFFFQLKTLSFVNTRSYSAPLGDFNGSNLNETDIQIETLDYHQTSCE